jgi:hypothetical protein
MKRSAMLCALGVALAALTLTADVAFAAVTVNNSKSNTFKTTNVNDAAAAAVADCTKGGGTVGKDPKGNDACVTPKKK